MRSRSQRKAALAGLLWSNVGLTNKTARLKTKAQAEWLAHDPAHPAHDRDHHEPAAHLSPGPHLRTDRPRHTGHGQAGTSPQHWQPMLSIESGPFRLAATPALGGSLAALEWQGHPLLRPQQGQDVLGSACFPLLPFSNRLRASRFSWHGQTINLDPNHPHDPSEPVLHGFGWRQPWQVSAHAPDRLALSLHMPAGPWPWPFHAEQLFVLDARHAQLSLAITNLGPTPMPAGLGFHPYFPRDAATVLHALHSGEWQVDAARLPTHLIRHDTAIDWWHGQPVATRPVDTVYTGRTGPLAIHWPGRGIGLTITPDASLSCTTIYVPPAQPFFCVEPVSHATDALNRPGTDHGMRLLAPGERWQVTLRLTPFMRP